MENDLAEILITREQIQRRVGELGRQIAQRYRVGDPPLVVAILYGCILFLADLVRELPIPLDLEFVYCKSYSGASRGILEFGHRASLAETVRGRRVLLVDDIFDTGRTLTRAADELRRLGAAEVTTAVLLVKRGCVAEGSRAPDLVGFEIDNRFVVGYGLDYDGRYRNLPCIAVLRPEAMKRGA